MKRKNILLGSVGIIATAAAFVFAPMGSENGKYTRKSLSSIKDRSALDAQAWLQARFIDHQTGLPLTPERLQEISNAVAELPRTRAMSFIELGPHNIGGRTRAIQVDQAVSNRVWCGGVTGGLFKSDNGANSWEYIATYEGAGASPNISSMAQFSDGTLFVATGSNQEPFPGNGVWYTTDAGETWTVVPGTENLTRVTEIYAPQNSTTLYMATQTGLKTWSPGETGLTSIQVASSISAPCGTIAGSDNGQVIVVAMTSSNKTYVSTDGGQSWTDKSQQTTSAARVEYAISKPSGGVYKIYAVFTNANLKGIYQSTDTGNTWSEVVGAVDAEDEVDIMRGQGGWNLIASVMPTNSGKLLVGGIDIWKWQEAGSGGTISQLTQWWVNPSSSTYAHADQHEMKWDGNKLYIGNDGGVGVTMNPEAAWYPANRGLNITQFYGIAADRHGSVLGGTQDNGSLYNNHTFSTWEDFTEVTGGDGFQCAVSFYNPDILFTSVQYGDVNRSGDGGQTSSPFIPSNVTFQPNAVGEAGVHPFHTNLSLEEYYDINSEDSVTYLPTVNASAGETIKVPSAATGDTINYVLTTDVFYNDTVNYDPVLTNTNAISVVDEISGFNIYLDYYTWNHLGTSGSGATPPQVGDSLTYSPNGVLDTIVVQSVGTFTHYQTTNPSTGQTYSMGLDSAIFNVSWDTLRVQDPYQSWFLLYSTVEGGSIWGTRDALRLSSSDVKWGIVAKGLGQLGAGTNEHHALDMKFSKDLNHLFITTGSTQLRRIDGLGSIYTSDEDFEAKAFHNGTTQPTGTVANTFSIGGNLQGVAVNPNNADDIVLFRGTQQMRRSNNNATSASPTFSNVGNIAGSSSPAAYDGIIDRENSDILVVGTSHGVFYTENGGTSWEDASAGFTGTPVFEVIQNWRPWDQGNFRPGEIYVGTYGRGIWSSSSYLNLPNNGGNNNDEVSTFEASLIAFPNPSAEVSNLKFDLNYSSDVTVKVYNLAGREMISVEKENMKSGTNTIPLNIENLTKGTYIVKLSAGKDKLTTKIMKF